MIKVFPTLVIDCGIIVTDNDFLQGIIIVYNWIMTDSQARYEQLLAKLRQSDYRMTPQRISLLRLIATSEDHPSAAQLI